MTNNHTHVVKKNVTLFIRVVLIVNDAVTDQIRNLSAPRRVDF